MAMCGGSFKFLVRIPKISFIRFVSAKARAFGDILLPCTSTSTSPATLVQQLKPQHHLLHRTRPILLQNQMNQFFRKISSKAEEGKKMIIESAEDHHQIYKAAQAKGLRDDMYAADWMLFVVGLLEHIVEEDLFKYFGVKEAHIRRDPVTRRSCGYAMVNFGVRFGVYEFSDMKHRIKDCWVTAWIAAPGGSNGTGERPVIFREDEKNDRKIDSSYSPLIPGHGTIYVGGFSFVIKHVDESTIFRYFSSYGDVDAVELPRLDQSDSHGCDANEEFEDLRSCRWALVRFTNPYDADKAIAESPHYIDGVHVIVHPTDGRLLHEVTGYREDPCIIEKRLTKATAEKTEGPGQ